MAVTLAVVSTPLSWLFTTANRHHSGILMSPGIAAFLLAWAAASAVAGVFAIAGSVV